MNEPKAIAPKQRRKSGKSGDGLSDAAVRNRAKALGWVKGCGESVEVFMSRSGWTRVGDKNSARWFHSEE
ncbi:MAG: hypothetical protein LH660_19400 [Phormidesmis sp. CAN_BIN36]|nr:hypothetical protein [Phormidesmis sp. CAN_BIN36]